MWWCPLSKLLLMMFIVGQADIVNGFMPFESIISKGVSNRPWTTSHNNHHHSQVSCRYTVGFVQKMKTKNEIAAAMDGTSFDGDDSVSTTITRNQFWNCTATTVLAMAMIATTTTSSSCSPANAMTTDSKTGIALPDEGEIALAVPTDWSVAENPFEESSTKFTRLDSTSDTIFYKDPRFVEHVDEQAVQLMTQYISQNVIAPTQKQSDTTTTTILDLCSSWTSHIDPSAVKNNNLKVSGLGMNAKELERNSILNDWVIRDLNANPVLPYDDSTFDVVLCQLSIDYLTRPKDVLNEVGRVLKPGGTVHILFSNRLFLSKVS